MMKIIYKKSTMSLEFKKVKLLMVVNIVFFFLYGFLKILFFYVYVVLVIVLGSHLK